MVTTERTPFVVHDIGPDKVVSVPAMGDDQSFTLIDSPDLIRELNIGTTIRTILRPLYNVRIINSAPIQTISINNCIMAGMTIYNTPCCKLEIDHTTFIGLDAVISLPNAGSIRFNQVESLHGTTINLYDHTHIRMTNCRLPDGQIIASDKYPLTEWILLDNVTGLIRLEGNFNGISIKRSDLSKCTFRPTGYISSAYGTIGDGTYIKSFTYHGYLFTYSSNRLWIHQDKDWVQNETSIALTDLADGDGISEIYKCLDSKYGGRDQYRLPIATIIDMILDDPAKEIPRGIDSNGAD